MAPSRGGKSSVYARPSKSKSTTTSKPKHDRADASAAGLQEQRREIPLSLQQSLLDCIGQAFKDIVDPSAQNNNLSTLLQEVKGHLYNRDFASAFGRQDYLDVYAARWSASRALGYIEVFAEAIVALGGPPVLANTSDKAEGALSLEEVPGQSNKTQDDGRGLRIVCLGGGAGAELCAFAALSRLLQSEQLMHITLVDSADWTSVNNKLSNALTIPTQSSQYASTAIKAATSFEPLIAPRQLSTTIQQVDIVDPSDNARSQLASSLSSASLITLAFTLNELYSTSISATQSFLLNLTTTVCTGTLLLIIDSPGTYSTVSINGNEKQYPMAWLLKHTLLTSAPRALAADDDDGSGEGDDDVRKGRKRKELPPLWEQVTNTPSRWFRLRKELKYPMELENMRYQMSLWRRL